jgi:arabinan endo-1,5-alpha-L-arabinosidase
MAHGFLRSFRAPIAAAAAALSATLAIAQAERPAGSINERMSGSIAPVHDPAIIREGDTFYLFSTGPVAQDKGIIPWRSSKDLINWTHRGAVFQSLPAWATDKIPGTKGLWAPDIIFTNNEYRLYYSVSTFGKNRSAIGLATTPTLDPSKPGYGWTDKGLVFSSNHKNDYNAIDPHIFVDRDGKHWMSFGSFWTGIKVVELDPATGKPVPDARVRALAARRDPGAIEAPFIIERNGFYYLFASFEFCCRGIESTYFTVVGRSKSVLGPYEDHKGRSMMSGGGTPVLHADLDPTKRWKGPGHVAILREPKRDFIVYHAYDAQNKGASSLRIQPLAWTPDGWPVAS